MKKLLERLSVFTFFVFFISACGGDDNDGPDTDAPTVVINVPAEGGTYYRGEDLPLDAIFKDNKALNECVVTIIYNGQALGASAVLKGIGSPWTPAISEEYGQLGEEYIITFEEEKEKDVLEAKLFNQSIEGACLPGSYTLALITSDKTGNMSEEKVNIIIE